VKEQERLFFEDLIFNQSEKWQNEGEVRMMFYYITYTLRQDIALRKKVARGIEVSTKVMEVLMLKCIFQEPFNTVYRAYKRNCQCLTVTLILIIKT
jgi:hypothetical protein